MALWGLGIAVIMNPKRGIASSFTAVVNANLYFSSWACFCCCIWLVGSLAQEMFGFDVTRTSPKRAKAYALVASSLVVMGSSVRIFSSFQCSRAEMQGVAVCARTKFAISAGVVGFLISIIWTIAVHVGLKVPFFELFGSLILLIIWIFGLSFITFGDGPGHSIGNLYFATWICLILSIFLFAEAFTEVLGAYQTGSEQQEQSSSNPHESTVPEMGDMEEEDL